MIYYESLDVSKMSEKIRNFLIEEDFDLTKTVKKVDVKFLETYDIHHKKFGKYLKLSFIPELYQDLKHSFLGTEDVDDVIIETYKQQIKNTRNTLEFKSFLIKKRFTQNK